MFKDFHRFHFRYSTYTWSNALSLKMRHLLLNSSNANYISDDNIRVRGRVHGATRPALVLSSAAWQPSLDGKLTQTSLTRPRILNGLLYWAMV